MLHQELSSLLLKGAIEEVPQSDLKLSFFSCYFLVPKKDGGLRPIVDLRRSKLSLYKGKFKMLTLKIIMSQIVTVDLKDAYFHIQVVRRHRTFLQFAFGGKAYQYKVLPFGLALAPRTFTKCMDAALAPLRLQGISVLNYLDDWLILAHSRELVRYHRDIILHHIHALGLRTNTKRVFSPLLDKLCFGGSFGYMLFSFISWFIGQHAAVCCIHQTWRLIQSASFNTSAFQGQKNLKITHTGW